MKKSLVALVCLSTLFWGGWLHAQPKSTEDWSRRSAFVNPEKANEKIIASWDGGQWQKEGIKGSFRFLLTEYKPRREKLYIQWITSSGEIAYSMSVVELNQRPEYDLAMPECLDDNCRELHLDAHHYYENLDRQFNIRLDGLGSYTFSF